MGGAGGSAVCGGGVSRVSVGRIMAGPLLCTGGSMVLREVVLDVVIVAQLFAVRDENMLFSLEVLISLCRRVVAGGTAGGSGKEGSVMAGKRGAGVGSGIGTSMGSGIELSGAGGREARPNRPFGFFLVVPFGRPMVSVVYGEDRVSGGIETVQGGKTRVRGWGLVDCVSGTVLSESGKAGRESRAVMSRRWW